MITHIHIDIVRDAVVVLIASSKIFLRASRQSRRELRWVGVCNHGCHWTTYFSSLGELVNPLQSNVHVAAHSYSMYQKAALRSVVSRGLMKQPAKEGIPDGNGFQFRNLR